MAVPRNRILDRCLLGGQAPRCAKKKTQQSGLAIVTNLTTPSEASSVFPRSHAIKLAEHVILCANGVTRINCRG